MDKETKSVFVKSALNEVPSMLENKVILFYLIFIFCFTQQIQYEYLNLIIIKLKTLITEKIDPMADPLKFRSHFQEYLMNFDFAFDFFLILFKFVSLLWKTNLYILFAFYLYLIFFYYLFKKWILEKMRLSKESIAPFMNEIADQFQSAEMKKELELLGFSNEDIKKPIDIRVIITVSFFFTYLLRISSS